MSVGTNSVAVVIAFVVNFGLWWNSTSPPVRNSAPSVDGRGPRELVRALEGWKIWCGIGAGPRIPKSAVRPVS